MDYWTNLTSLHHVFTNCIQRSVGLVELRVANYGPRLVVRIFAETAPVNGRSDSFQRRNLKKTAIFLANGHVKHLQTIFFI